MIQGDKDIQLKYKQLIYDRFIKLGLETLEPQEVLELLLSFSTSDDNVNSHASLLFEHFHSFVNIMNADYKTLSNVPGVTKQTAVLIRLAAEISRFTNIQRASMKKLTDKSQIIDYLQPYFTDLVYEKLYMLCLDNSNHVLSLQEVSNESFTQVTFNIHQITREAVRINAAKTVLAHNHPRGTPYPSSSDHAATTMIRRSLAAVNVSLIDHIIIANGEAISMREKFPLDDWR